MSDEGNFAAGDVVRVAGLVSRPDLNGASVALIAFDAAAGRWTARAPSGELLKIRPASLEHAPVSPAALAALAASRPRANEAGLAELPEPPQVLLAPRN
jgi:hypothetical protein